MKGSVVDGDGPDGTPPSGTPSEVSSARVAAVQAAADTVLADGQVYAVRTPTGEVRICRITSHQEGEAHWVEVHLHGETAGGDPHFRIFNPPTLAADPMGPIEINGQRFREDPMAAVAQVVASLGGASTNRTRRSA